MSRISLLSSECYRSSLPKISGKFTPEKDNHSGNKAVDNLPEINVLSFEVLYWFEFNPMKKVSLDSVKMNMRKNIATKKQVIAAATNNS